MPLSMTGYGRAENHGEGFSHVWEIKSVNGRYLDVKWRLPATLRSREAHWERMVRTHGSRGRVDVSLNLEVFDPDLLGVSLDTAQAKAMLGQLEGLAKERGQEFVPDLNRFLSVPWLWRDSSREPAQALVDSLDKGLELALADWDQARTREGEAMLRDLSSRRERLLELSRDIAGRIPAIVEEKRTALFDRIREAMEAADAGLGEDRMLQEAALLADRLDVSEELTRLEEHLRHLGEVLAASGEVGKRLDFLLQEIFREINTCANKSQDPETSRLAVEFKAELEKCREQVQNIE